MPVCALPWEVVAEMQEAGLVAKDARPDPDGQCTVTCDLILAGWCRARAMNYRHDNADRALAFIVAAEMIEAELQTKPRPR
jgi:hypothetical protein